MNIKRLVHLIAALIISVISVWLLTSSMASLANPPLAALAAIPLPPTHPHVRTPSIPTDDNPNPPTETAKLIFIHHSTGENWLADWDGGLGLALADNNYFVSDTNYGWGPPDADLGYENIGDHTDIGHWYNWFVGPNYMTYTNALYTEYITHSYYTRLTDPDPGRENEIIMFKSCYPNSYISGSPTDPPTSGPNSLRGQDAWSEHMTVANVKGIYNDILGYFATQTDKLFVLIVSPPQIQSETDATHAANARAVANWLVNDWLDGYPHNNVAVFDFYNVLTSNGDDANTNDLDWPTGNHHRWLMDAVQHTQTVDNDFSAYGGGSGGGSHPTAAGGQKATGEFIPTIQPPACPYPLTSVAISGPTSGPSASTTNQAATSQASATTERQRKNIDSFDFNPLAVGQFPAAANQSSAFCPPLDPPSGNVVTVDTVAELQSAVNSASSGTTILVADGTYDLDGVYLRFDVPNVTLRSANGNRENVVLDGDYVTTEIVQIVASNVTIADLTLREAYHHPIHVTSSSSSNTTGTLIYNVHIIDPRQQAIKINPYTGENALYFPDSGTIACSHIELSNAGRPNVDHESTPCYTGGVDAHQARDWIIRDNLIEGFWCESGLSEHGIHMWRSCRDTLVERNDLRDNARGIGFGLVTSGTGIRTYPDNPCPGADGGYVDHYGGIIRNNFVFADDTGLFASEYGFDCGICLWQACGAQAVHNTIASTQAPFSSIEWFLPLTDVDVINNLVTHNLRDRGGTAYLAGNLESQPLSLFADGSNGDLHLVEGATAAIDQGVSLTAGLCDDDIDGDTRPFGSAPDVGADEYRVQLPTLSLVTPIGGTAWPVSSTRHIRWTTSGSGSIPLVSLAYSADGFVTSQTITSPLANIGVYTWTTPPTPTTSAQVRVASVTSPTLISDTSGLFRLYDPSTFTNTIYLPLVLRNYIQSQTNGDLVQPGDLTYLGAFRLPDMAPGTPATLTWEYSGQALTYRPDGDPGGGGDGYPGSLFGTGHDVLNYVSEVSVPAPSTSRNLELLNVATTIQGFEDVRGGLFDGLVEMPRVGMQYLPAQAGQTSAKLHLTWGAHHHDEGSPSDTPSHAWCDLDLSTPNTQGAWWIGDVSLYRVNGYIFEIPQEWADTHLGGARLATGRYRDGGWSGMGPNIFAYGPWLDGSPPLSGTHLTAHTVLSYSFAGGEHTISNYHDSDEWEGGAWLTVEDKTAVVFVGTKGGGYWWYGYSSPAGDGMPCPFIPPPESEDEVRCYNPDGTDCAEELLDCEGYIEASRGWWSSRFDAQMIFYDPADFVAVLNGTMEPYEPQPYATLGIDDHLFLNPPVETEVDCGTGDQRKCRISEMAYDRERGFLYVLERFADDSKPVVHVWSIQG